MQQPIGILAGGGTLPGEVARSVVAHGGRVHLLAIDGEADGDFSDLPCTRVPFGAIGGMLKALQSAGCREMVIIGSVRRPDIWRARPDAGFFWNLPAIIALIRAGGDDGVLRRVVGFFESKGFRVVGPDAVAPDLVARAGHLAGPTLDEAAQADATLGFLAIRTLGPLDIGQAVVTRAARLVAVEGVEGTDGLLRRLKVPPGAALGGAGSGSGVLVKRPKPGQELRVDMPVIGPRTVELAAAAGLRGIVVQAGNVLVAERARLTERAEALGISVTARDDLPAGTDTSPALGAGAQGPVRILSGAPPVPEVLLDAARARAAVAALVSFGQSAAAFVARRHVLAAGVDETPLEILERVAVLRQWGQKRPGKPRGVLCLADASALDADVVAMAGSERVAAIVVLRPTPDDAERLARLASAWPQLGIFAPADEEH